MTHTNNRWQRVSERAFDIYRARGGAEGRHVDDWLEAERQIDDEDGRESTGVQNAAEDRAAVDGTTPEERDSVSQVPRGKRKHGKSATL